MSEETLARTLIDTVLECLDADTVAQVTDAQYGAALEAVARLLHEAYDTAPRIGS